MNENKEPPPLCSEQDYLRYPTKPISCSGRYAGGQSIRLPRRPIRFGRSAVDYPFTLNRLGGLAVLSIHGSNRMAYP